MENFKQTDLSADDSSPVYYNTNHLSLIAILAGIFSWVVLAMYLANVVSSSLFLKAQLANGIPLREIIVDPQAQAWLFSSIGSPLMLGITFFFVLQGVSLGLNALLEIDLSSKE